MRTALGFAVCLTVVALAAASLLLVTTALVLVFFVGCGISRLARYNITAEKMFFGATVAPGLTATEPAEVLVWEMHATVSGW